MTNYKTIALIVAAGSGIRAGGGMPKQYHNIGGFAVLRHTVLAFVNHPQIDAVKVVYNPNDKELYDLATKGLDILSPVAGGKTRQESVRLGLQSLTEFMPNKVLIHDAARPFICSDLITNVISGVEKYAAVVPVVAIEDTIKEYKNGEAIKTISRENLMRAQTPQGFVYENILNAHNKIKGKNFTDDAAIYEYLEKKVYIIQGSPDNFKITTKEDLIRAKKTMQNNYETRVGSGFDVHKFCAPKSDDNKIMLCGIAIPHEKSLEGHSDADVGLHAVVDAILGAIGKGDIGEYFPPSDDKYKNMDSAVFLKKAGDILAVNGGKISNIDVTIICERPKISHYKKDMIAKIADIMQISASRVNVKATTTEGLGFTGRGEGIAAQAVATIKVREDD